MALSGNWATPHLNGFDYVEKPPLGYWLCASSYKLFGVSERAARLPLAILSAFAIATTAWLGTWLYGAELGVLAAAFLSSCGLFFFLSHYITPDLPLTLFLFLCTAFILRSLEDPDHSGGERKLAWLCAALAFLSKGLVGLLFPVLWTGALAVLIPQWRKPARRLIDPIGILVFLALAAPWFLLMERRHPGFLHFIFIEQHFQRFATAKYNRTSPWYFFLLVLPAGLLPMAPLALSGLSSAVRSWRHEPRTFALALWTILVVAFFSVSQSKLATYILPVFPHCALLAAQASGKLKRPALLAYAGWMIGLLAFVGLFFTADRFSARSLGQYVASSAGPEDSIYVYGTYIHGLPYYSGRRVDRIINWTGELHYAKRNPANAGRFGDDEDIHSLPNSGKPTVLVLRAFEASHVLKLLQPAHPKTARQIGPWVVLKI
jgi:4-amino-4-deoxy-L-arabinose transferase-like glycosyltransferase